MMKLNKKLLFCLSALGIGLIVSGCGKTSDNVDQQAGFAYPETIVDRDDMKKKEATEKENEETEIIIKNEENDIDNIERELEEEIVTYSICENSLSHFGDIYKNWQFQNGVAWVSLMDNAGNQFTGLINNKFELLYRTDSLLTYAPFPFDDNGYSYYRFNTETGGGSTIVDKEGNVTWQGDGWIFGLGEGLFAFQSVANSGYNHTDPTFGIMDGNGNILLNTTAEEFPFRDAIDPYNEKNWNSYVSGGYGLLINEDVYNVQTNTVFSKNGTILKKDENGNYLCVKEDHGKANFTEYNAYGEVSFNSVYDLPEDAYEMIWEYLGEDIIIRYNDYTDDEGTPLLFNTDGTLRSDFGLLGDGIIIRDVSKVENGMFAIMLVGVGDCGYVSVLDTNGNIILAPMETESSYGEFFADGLLKVVWEGKTSFYNLDGECEFTVPTEEVAGFSDGYAFTRYGYYDTGGRFYSEVTECVL